MKTEATIRAYRDDLRRIIAAPCDCDCAAEGHALECAVGGKMMEAVHDALMWALDDDGDLDRLVEQTARAARRIRNLTPRR
jgi:hypothetical protein